MTLPAMVNRARSPAVGLETTLLAHGVPRDQGPALAESLAAIVRDRGVDPAYIGLFRGTPTVGLTPAELAEMLAATPSIPKANTANLGVLMHRRSHAATTVSTTIELAAAAGVRVVATGGLGGVHKDLAKRLDVSADLAALARHPVVIVTSGCKSILDVEGTREMLETLGVPVIGFRTDRFPAFYLRESDARVDARFDDPADLASFADAELARSGRAVVVANPIPETSEIPRDQWDRWLVEAEAAAASASGRDSTPALLAQLHTLSSGATLKANIALVRSNTHLGAELAARIGRR